MIVKSFEIDKIKNSQSKFFLFYGDNQGLKGEILDLIKKKKVRTEVFILKMKLLKILKILFLQ